MEHKSLHRFNGEIKKKVHQTAQDSHSAGQQEMKRLLAQAKLIPNPQCVLPMPPEQSARKRKNPIEEKSPEYHALRLRHPSRTDEIGFLNGDGLIRG